MVGPAYAEAAGSQLIQEARRPAAAQLGTALRACTVHNRGCGSCAQEDTSAPADIGYVPSLMLLAEMRTVCPWKSLSRPRWAVRRQGCLQGHHQVAVCAVASEPLPCFPHT
jgi:hypothetical protein